jgi:hypothetical protein
MQRELQRPEIEAKPDWHGRNEVEAIKNPERMGCFDPQSMIYDPSSISSLLHSRFFASIRGSKSLNESALRGRIALPGGPSTPFFLSASSAIYDPSPLLSWFLGMIFTILPSFIT